MPLSSGDRLGPYEIAAFIGAGGMGEVYRGRDTRLDRTVAIKVLLPGVPGDESRRKRFEREARAISSLDHPHICTLHDVGVEGGRDYMVMEYCEGETLAALIARKGGVPLERALEYGTQIADALASAHRVGIVHRDLKPNNVMVTRSGAMLLDFGLARLLDPAGAADTTLPLTAVGAIVGTVRYMAPEQLQGAPADARSDIFALGVLLYEMVTGRRPFEGGSREAVIAAILEHEPQPPSSRQPLVPPALDHLVIRCLAKAPEDRWESARDLAEQLRWLGASAAAREPVAQRRGGTFATAAALVGGMLGVAGIVALVSSAAPSLFGRATAARPTTVARLLLDVNPAEELRSAVSNARIVTPGGSRTAFSWTPDGRTLVFAGRADGMQQLFARPLDRDEGQPLKGTRWAEAPVVSADGAWVAFWASGAIKKIAFAGGGPVTDLAAPLDRPPVGMVWDEEGNLFYANTDGRIWVARASGELAAVTQSQEGEWRQILPALLPGGKVLLYTARKQETGWRGDEIVAVTLGTGERKVLLRDAVDARYVATRHLVFLRRGVLYGVAFDPDRLELKGQPVPLIDGVSQALEVADYSGAGQYAIGAGGRLAWLRGMPTVGVNRRLVSLDRRGSVTPAKVTEGPFGFTVRISPEGRRAALFLDELTGRSLWVYDLERGTPTPLNREGDSGYAAHWSPDGLRVAYRWIREGRAFLTSQRADGAGKPEVIAAGTQLPVSWMPDGRGFLAVSGEGGAHVWDFWLATWAGGSFGLRRLTDGPTYRHSPELSPDGRWLAYVARTQSRAELYVQPFPGPGPAVQVSLEGGFSPAWRRDGRELFFANPDPRLLDVWHMMSVDVSPGPPLRTGTPRRLFDFTPDLSLGGYPMRVYDVSPDGERFYATQELTGSLPPSPPVTQIQIIENWFEELTAKVPPER